MKLTIGKAAKKIGVTVVTLREWEKLGKVLSERTKRGHRRSDLETVLGCASLRKDSERVTLIYARVSTSLKKEVEEYGNCSENSAPAQPCS